MGKEQEEAYSRREFLKRYGTRIGAAVLLSGAGSLAAPLIENGILGNELYPSSENLNPNPYPSPYGSIILPPSYKPPFIPWSSSNPAEPAHLPSPTPDKTPKPVTSETIKANASEIVWSGDKTKPYIYLTVDDCYDPKMVVKAMNAAEKAGVKLTFFPIGTNVARNPGLFKEAYLRGHAIENHTYTHEWLDNKSASNIEYQILKQHEAVQNAIGKPYKQHFLRPPGGAGVFRTEHPWPLLWQTAQNLGYKIAMWTAD